MFFPEITMPSNTTSSRETRRQNDCTLRNSDCSELNRVDKGNEACILIRKSRC